MQAAGHFNFSRSGTLNLPWVVGLFAIVGGAVAIWNSFKARGLQKV